MTRGDVANDKFENVRDMKYFNTYNENKTFKDTLLRDLIDQKSPFF